MDNAEMAEILGQLSSAFVARGLVGCLWLLCGWLATLTRVLQADLAKAQAEVTNVKQAFSNFKNFKAHAGRHAGITAVANTSVCNFVQVQQLVGLCAQNKWKVCIEIKDSIRGRNESMICSHVCEDGFTRQKNVPK